MNFVVALATKILTPFRAALVYFFMWLNVHNNLLWLIRDGGKWGDGYRLLPPTRYTVTTRMTLH